LRQPLFFTLAKYTDQIFLDTISYATVSNSMISKRVLCIRYFKIIYISSDTIDYLSASNEME
jgi:hypothetical protein